MAFFGFRNKSYFPASPCFGAAYRGRMIRETNIDSLQTERRSAIHELNNGLAVIIAECDLLEEILAEQTAALARIKVIKRAAQHMADRIAARP